MSRGPVSIKTGGTGVNDNDEIFEIEANAEDFDTWIIGSTAGAMDVFVSLDGTNYLADAFTLTDQCSTAPATKVALTTAGRGFGLYGRYKKIRVLQNGATAVANAALIGFNA